ncbi:MAG: DOMON domain-containing protein [Candidatus Electrothrix sp. AR3]|nr:DOMON domain-containing protein [Candidatus Electrothrix sp. AR3]
MENTMKGSQRGGVIVALVYLLTSWSFGFAQEYDHETKVQNMSFSWKVDASELKVKLSAKTTGWVGVGFNPSSKMKDANFILGYVKKDGKVKISDEYGDSEHSHKTDKKLGGAKNVTLVDGSEKDGLTTVEFTLPLSSGEKTDTVIDPKGETVVLLAYGGARDSFKAKHTFRTAITVNLLSGEVK